MSSPVSCFVFVDFENMSDVDLSLVAGKPVEVTLLIGKNQKKLDLTLVKQIHQFAAQVALVEMSGSGRNALDMTLAYYLGRRVERFPAAEFYVVSKDKDYDPMLAHLLTGGARAFRSDSFSGLPFLKVPEKTLPPASPVAKKASPRAPRKSAAPAAPVRRTVTREEKIRARLGDRTNKSRPSTVSGMVAHIKNALGQTADTAAAQQVMDRLQAEGAFTVTPANKIIYV